MTWPPSRTRLFDAQDPLDETLEVVYGAVATGVVEASGGWYTWGGDKFHGEAAFVGAVLGLGRLDEMRDAVVRRYIEQAEVSSGPDTT